MLTNYDRMIETLKEIKVPHSTFSALTEPKVITLANNAQGTKCLLVFTKDGKFDRIIFE